jgi:hypothetical protein
LSGVAQILGQAFLEKYARDDKDYCVVFAGIENEFKSNDPKTLEYWIGLTQNTLPEIPAEDRETIQRHCVAIVTLAIRLGKIPKTRAALVDMTGFSDDNNARKLIWDEVLVNFEMEEEEEEEENGVVVAVAQKLGVNFIENAGDTDEEFDTIFKPLIELAQYEQEVSSTLRARFIEFAKRPAIVDTESEKVSELVVQIVVGALLIQDAVGLAGEQYWSDREEIIHNLSEDWGFDKKHETLWYEILDRSGFVFEEDIVLFEVSKILGGDFLKKWENDFKTIYAPLIEFFPHITSKSVQRQIDKEADMTVAEDFNTRLLVSLIVQKAVEKVRETDTWKDWADERDELISFLSEETGFSEEEDMIWGRVLQRFWPGKFPDYDSHESSEDDDDGESYTDDY